MPSAMAWSTRRSRDSSMRPWLTGVARDAAPRVLAEGVDPCPHCRPDSNIDR
ncbi:DUF6233 domain-containing protein [Streptomyces sp. NPDC051001]|uniref:DUF6233 domain-containing protein n=1 Tax=Streptomyces sp. NPDC051001 TaxID=3155795 RepID=UPI003419D62A